MASLNVIEGPDKGRRFELGRANLIMIGRDPSCTLQILDPKLSRMHLQIKALGEAEGHAAVDFKSSNGVFVNGNRISAETPLTAGDLIRIGDTEIVYQQEETPKDSADEDRIRRNRQRVITTQLEP